MDEKIEQHIPSMTEEENLRMLYDHLTKYRIKLSGIIGNIENGRFVFAHQKLQGLERALDHLRNKMALRVREIRGEEDESNSDTKFSEDSR